MPRTEDLLFSDLHEQNENDPAADYDTAAVYIRARYSSAQQEACDDKSPCKAILACRRTGKSYFAGSELVSTCLEIPYANCLYITLTKGSGRAIIWGFLKKLDREFSLNAKFHNTNLTVTFQNGSVLSLVGAENRSEIDKIRGQGYDLVVIDECKSFPVDVMEELITEVITPALMDRMGDLVLIGTPGAILAGQFYEITHENLGRTSRLWRERWDWPEDHPFLWSVHIWSLDDAALPIIKEKAYAIKEANGWADDYPPWAREYMGKWVPSANALVYHYNWDGTHKNDYVPDPDSTNIFGLPADHDWTYLMGIDLGFNDDFALVVGAYSPTHPNLYQVYAYKSPHLIVEDIAVKIKQVEKLIGGYEVCVGDAGGLGKMILETLAAQYDIAIIPAEKKAKLDYIELLNNDLVAGRCLVDPDGLLAEEWKVLQFDVSGEKEHPGCANHASDAFLYLWRYAYHRFHRERPKVLEPGSRAWWDAKEKKAAEDAAKEVLRQQDLEYWEIASEGMDMLGENIEEDLWVRDLVRRKMTSLD